MGKVVDLSESFMATCDKGEPSLSVSPATECEKVLKCESDLYPDTDLSSNVTRELLIEAQKNDLPHASCMSSVVAAQEDDKHAVFFLDNGVLMRRWSLTQTCYV